MNNFKQMLQFTIMIYKFRLVTITVTVEQLAVYNKFYVMDEKLKLPMWLSQIYFQNNYCTIDEFENLDSVINNLFSSQNMNHKSLVPIEEDFYLLVNDYFNFYMKYKLRYLEINDTITENDKLEQEQEIKDNLKQQKNMFKNLVNMRRKILLISCYHKYNRSLAKNMTFEECLIYQNICNTLNHFNENFGYTLHDNT